MTSATCTTAATSVATSAHEVAFAFALRESLPVVPQPLFASATAEESISGCLLARVPTLPACTGMFGTKEALLHAVQQAWNKPVRPPASQGRGIVMDPKTLQDK